MKNCDFITKNSCIAILRHRFRGLWIKYRDEREQGMRSSRDFCRREMKKVNRAIKILNK